MTGSLHEGLRAFSIYLAQFLLKWDISVKFVEKNKTQFMFSNIFRKSCRSWENVEKYGRDGRAGQVTDHNMAHVHCMLGN